MNYSRRSIFITVGASLILLGLIPFQNCGRPSKVSDVTDGGLTAAPAKTRFYFGRNGGIDAIELDHASATVTRLSSATFAGQTVGWLAYDKTSRSVFAADAGSAAKLERFTLDPLTGSLTSVLVKDYLPGIVHLSVVPMQGVFHLFASNYNAGTAGYHTLTDGALNAGQSVSFGATAKTHSSAYDPSRRLLFIATLGLNKIQVFRVNAGTITPAGDIPVDSPRTVVFDEQFDKVYVSTEAYAGNSFIKGYSVTPAGANFTFTEVASMPTSLIGADLKVNHARRYVMATSRESGRQAINGMPVKPDGTLDAARTSFSISLSQVQPRSLEVTDDGDFAVVAMNSSTAENLVVFKMNFDARSQFTGSARIFAQKIGTEGYVCATSVPVK